MKKIRFLAGAALCAGLLAAIAGGGIFYARRDTAYRQKMIEPMQTYRLSAFTEVEARREIRLCAHRGLSAVAPENTLESIRAAGDAGFSLVQLDVAVTKDGEAVLLYDETIDRMTAGRGRVRAMTAQQLAQFPLDNGAHIADYERVQIPLLRDALALCAQYGMQPILSLRTVRGTLPEALLRQAYGIVSTQKDVLASLEGQGVRLCYRTDALTERDVRYALQHGCALAFDPQSTPDRMLRAGWNVELWAWQVNTRETLAHLAENGVRNMVTDCILPITKK